MPRPPAYIHTYTHIHIIVLIALITLIAFWSERATRVTRRLVKVSVEHIKFTTTVLKTLIALIALIVLVAYNEVSGGVGGTHEVHSNRPIDGGASRAVSGRESDALLRVVAVGVRPDRHRVSCPIWQNSDQTFVSVILAHITLWIYIYTARTHEWISGGVSMIVIS